MLKTYFLKNNINLKSFAKKHNLDYQIFYRVITGKLTGRKYSTGKTKAVFEKLLELKIIDSLPNGLKGN